MTLTWYEQGVEQGVKQGQRRMLLFQIEDRFGPLSEGVQKRIEEYPADELRELALRVHRAVSLQDLGLED